MIPVTARPSATKGDERKLIQWGETALLCALSRLEHGGQCMGCKRSCYKDAEHHRSLARAMVVIFLLLV